MPVNPSQQVSAASAHADDPFPFLRYHPVPAPTGHQVRTLREFRAAWVDMTLARHELAERLSQIDRYAGTLDRVRERYRTALNRAVEEEDQA
jgi:hypothetical protein